MQSTKEPSSFALKDPPMILKRTNKISRLHIFDELTIDSPKRHSYQNHASPLNISVKRCYEKVSPFDCTQQGIFEAKNQWNITSLTSRNSHKKRFDFDGQFTPSSRKKIHFVDTADTEIASEDHKLRKRPDSTGE